MNTIKKEYLFPVIVLILFSCDLLHAQSEQRDPLQTFQFQRVSVNKTAMIVLGSWAAGNILTGGYGNFKAKGEAKYFHQFNAFWNIVNLGIAAYGYASAVSAQPGAMTGLDILKEHTSLQNFLLLNAGLDIAYMTVGLYLRERAKNSSGVARLTGYGNSLLVQGGFLLVFDIALFFIHQQNASLLLYPHLDSLLSGGAGLGISVMF